MISQDLSAYLNNISFRGNIKLRTPGTIISYTQDMIDELIKCKSDPIYFIKKYVKIIHVDRGIINLELFPYQENLIRAYHQNKRVISMQPRQSGKTTVSAAFFLWFVLFHDSKTVAILANKQQIAQEILTRIQLAYEELPKWIQQGVTSWNKRSLDLENGSRILTAATSSSGIRGFSISCVDGSTVIRVRNRITGEEMEPAIGEFTKTINNQKVGVAGNPQLKKTTPKQTLINTDEWEVMTPSGWQLFEGVVITHNQEIIEIDGLLCTPNHQIVMEDIGLIEAYNLPNKKVGTGDVFDLVNVDNGNLYFTNNLVSHNCLYIDEWGFVENNVADAFFTSVYPTITSGKETKIFITSTPNGYNHFWKFWNEAEKKMNGFTPIRVHWNETPGRDIEWYNSQKQVLGELKTAQELDCNFLGSSTTLLTGATLSVLSPTIPIKEFKDGEYFGLKVYEQANPNRNYAMTVDVSRGRHLDSSAFIVFDVTEYPHRMVATYNNKDIAPLMYAALVYQIAKTYNNAYTLIEINDIGAQVAEEMYYTYEYDSMFWTKTGDLLGKRGADPFPGIRTTKKTKRIGCSNLKDIIEKQQLLINDSQTIQELSTFIQSRAGSYEADEGSHDDMCMCLVLFAWLITQPWFVDLYDKSMRNQIYQNTIKQMEDDLLPFFIVDATNDYVEDSPESLGMKYLI